MRLVKTDFLTGDSLWLWLKSEDGMMAMFVVMHSCQADATISRRSEKR